MDLGLGPLEILYCWQSIVLSCGVHVGTMVLKNAVILLAGDSKIKLAWAKEVAVPLLPLILGVLSAVYIQLLPDYLTAYIATHDVKAPWRVYAAYGASIGTFADYIHQRVASTLKIKAAHNESKGKA